MRIFTILKVIVTVVCLCRADGLCAEDRIWKVMPVGDAITAGGTGIADWRFPLWEKLTAAGYFIEYTGSQSNTSRIGTLRHEGRVGKTVEEMANTMVTVFPQNPADIVLLHAGHHHTADPNPVAGMLAATENLIQTCRSTNPNVIVLVAQVIPSVKPQYAYIPEFNAALPALAAQLNTANSPVIVVDQATGFDPSTDTTTDQMTPDESGAQKIRDRWFTALSSVLPSPEGSVVQPDILAYKSPVGSAPLQLHVFQPQGEPASMRPAIVFFFGGGWSSGTPLQFYTECRHFANLGYVAITADYRISSTHPGNTAFQSVADAKSAIRYLRSNATALGIDPARIVAAGASAGGHLAAATALLPGLDDPADNLAVSARPDALVLWYPVIDNGPGGYAYSSFGARYLEISPLHNVGLNPPPSLVMLGTADQYIPVATGQEFQKRLRAFGARSELILYPGGAHPLYAYRDPSATTKAFRATCLAEAQAFLQSLVLVSPRLFFAHVGHPLPPLQLRALQSASLASWSLVSGQLPAGVGLESTGNLVGTPHEEGEFPLMLRATSPGGFHDYEIVLRVATTNGPVSVGLTPPTATRNSSYLQRLSVRGAAGPSLWALASTTPLPSGISLSYDGILSGTPTAPAGDYPVTVLITDSAGQSTSNHFVLPVRESLERILDVGDAGVTVQGAWTSSTFNSGYYGTSYHHDGNTLKGSKSVTYQFSGLSPGTWSVSASWVTAANRSTTTPYTVQTSASSNTYVANQLVSAAAWNPLGTVTVPQDGNVQVILSNTNTSGFVTADAVRLAMTSPNPNDQYTRWAAALPPTQRGELADPLSTGLPNILAYYAGRAPLSVTSPLPLVRLDKPGFVRVFFNRSLPDLPAVLEGSPNLQDWQTLLNSTEAMTLPAGFDGDYWVPINNPTLRFFRLGVSAPSAQ